MEAERGGSSRRRNDVLRDHYYFRGRVESVRPSETVPRLPFSVSSRANNYQSVIRAGDPAVVARLSRDIIAGRRAICLPFNGAAEALLRVQRERGSGTRVSRRRGRREKHDNTSLLCLSLSFKPSCTIVSEKGVTCDFALRTLFGF